LTVLIYQKKELQYVLPELETQRTSRDYSEINENIKMLLKKYKDIRGHNIPIKFITESRFMESLI
jgi:hypothetical protein